MCEIYSVIFINSKLVIVIMRKKRSLVVLASLFILAGIVFMLENFNIVQGISKLWPVFVLLAGIGFLLLFFKRQKKDPALICIGTFLVLLSPLFFYLNFTSWRSLVYLWPLFIGISGGGFLVTGLTFKNKVYTYLAIALITGFFATYVMFSVALKLWPISLIFFGISLLIVDYFNKKERKNE